jgi:signal peptide peptidase SppA
MLSMPFFLRPWRRGRPSIPAVRLAGVIGSAGLAGRGLTLAGIERTLDAAFAHRHSLAVALLVNSPGGSPVQSALIAQRIRDLAEEKDKPVLAFVEDVAASGGYWLACAADEIYANACSIVGSIGVISAGFGFEQAIGRLGIERRVYTTGDRKALLDPFQAERPGDLELLKEIQDDILGRFVAHVRARRGERLRGSDGELFDGRVWTGDRALAHGLIDGLGEARGTIRDRFGKDARLMVANPRRSLLRRLRWRAGTAHILDEALAVLEEQAYWRRFGL